MISAVLFDMDGLLVDTERLHWESYRQVLVEEHGIEVGVEEYGEHWVRAGLGIVEFLELRRLPHDASHLRGLKDVRFNRLVAEDLQLMPGARELLERLHGVKRLALATACRAASVACILDPLGIGRYFEVLATAESVTRLKPEPDVFLHTAEKLGVPPDDCVVIEDAEKGVIAARRAGMAVIAVPNAITRGNDFTQASLVVSSLAEIDVDLLDALGPPAKAGKFAEGG